MDFSENQLSRPERTTVLSDNSQATIHPMVVYSTPTGPSDALRVQSYVMILDCLDHTTAAVATFQQLLLNELKSELPLLKRVHYFSDGAASQYKNRKNFASLCHHKEDFNLDATWHFFATSHGKSACDGIGGTLKRLAAKASLH